MYTLSVHLVPDASVFVGIVIIECIERMFSYFLGSVCQTTKALYVSIFMHYAATAALVVYCLS